MATIPSTMPEQVSLVKDLQISYRILHPPIDIYNRETNTKIKVPFYSIINKYKDYLSNIVLEVALSDEEQVMYMYKPKLVSEDLYDTTELWDTILLLNDCASVIEFKPKMLKVYDPSQLKMVLNEIMIIEESSGNILY